MVFDTGVNKFQKFRVRFAPIRIYHVGDKRRVVHLSIEMRVLGRWFLACQSIYFPSWMAIKEWLSEYFLGWVCEMNSASEIKAAINGRAGNMSKRNDGESDRDFALRLSRLASIDIKKPADVYVASDVTHGIAGFYVERGELVHVDGFERVING